MTSLSLDYALSQANSQHTPGVDKISHPSAICSHLAILSYFVNFKLRISGSMARHPGVGNGLPYPLQSPPLAPCPP